MEIECQGCYYTLCSFVCLTEDLSEILQFLWRHGCLRRSYACEKCGRKCAIGDKDLFFRCNRNTLDTPVPSQQVQNLSSQPNPPPIICPQSSLTQVNGELTLHTQIQQIGHHQYIISHSNSTGLNQQSSLLTAVNDTNSENLLVINCNNRLQQPGIIPGSGQSRSDSINLSIGANPIPGHNELNQSGNVNTIHPHVIQGNQNVGNENQNILTLPISQGQPQNLNKLSIGGLKKEVGSDEPCAKVLKKSNFKGEGDKKTPKKRCNFKVSMKKGTFFEKSKLPIDTVCKFVVFWCCMKHPTQEFLRNELSLATRTVVDWSTACRDICIHWAKSVSEKIGGDGVMVQIDEVKIQDSKESKQNDNGNKFSFWGMEKDKEKGKIFIVPVPACDSWSLLTVINDWILPGSIIISNCWKTYDCLKLQEFIQQTIVQSKTFVHPQSNAGQQNFEGKVDEAGASAGGELQMPRFGTRRSHHLGDLAEFMFKRRYSNHLERMHFFFKQISLAYPLH